MNHNDRRTSERAYSYSLKSIFTPVSQTQINARFDRVNERVQIRMCFGEFILRDMYRDLFFTGGCHCPKDY
jgi:hypothetical protein